MCLKNERLSDNFFKLAILHLFDNLFRLTQTSLFSTSLSELKFILFDLISLN